jgi:hypothetical protein
MWFSYGLDLTNTMQRQKEAVGRGEGAGKLPLWKRADERFFWNRYLMGKMIDLTENGGVDVSLLSSSVLRRPAADNAVEQIHPACALRM